MSAAARDRAGVAASDVRAAGACVNTEEGCAVIRVWGDQTVSRRANVDEFHNVQVVMNDQLVLGVGGTGGRGDGTLKLPGLARARVARLSSCHLIAVIRDVFYPQCV